MALTCDRLVVVTNETNGWVAWGGQVLTGSILISIMTGLSYLMVYAYELGYCQYFKIPFELITISLTNLLMFALSLIGIIIVALILAQAALSAKRGPVPVAAWVTAILSLVIAGVIYRLDQEKIVPDLMSNVMTLFAISIGGLGLALGLLLANKFDALFTDIPLPPLLSRLVILCPLGVLFFLSGAATLGFLNGVIKTDFAVIEETPPRVVLALYGNEVVTAQYFPCRHTIAGSLKLTTLDKVTALTVRHTGSLRYSDDTTLCGTAGSKVK
jgi:hypothetical protein